MTEITVTGCGDCPMHEDLCGAEWCDHPKHDNKADVVFDTCPLKNGNALTIKLQNNEQDTIEPTN